MKSSIVIAAHPDDEILWFSSKVQDAEQVIVCFAQQDSRPDWTRGRKASLAAYPLPNVNTLNLKIAEVFNHGNWQYPVSNQFGMALDGGRERKRQYETNFKILEDRLKEILKSYSHVFTHNPWGEYGHEEHVQVFRAVESLQLKLGFTLLVSNYVSNHSMQYMHRTIHYLDFESFSEPINRPLIQSVKDLYQKNGCWTWYPDYQWQEQDTFFQIRPRQHRKRKIGGTRPLNYINVGDVGNSTFFIKQMDRIMRRLSRFRNRFFR